MDPLRNKIWLALLVSAMLLAACTTGQVDTPPRPEPTLTSVAITAPKSPMQPGAATPAPVEPTRQPAAPQPAKSTADTFFQGPLSVKITGPLDEAVVKSSQVTLTGEADPETVISIDDQIVLVDAGHKFSIPLTLVEGPNIIEITASDLEGNQGSVFLTVIYDPES